MRFRSSSPNPGTRIPVKCCDQQVRALLDVNTPPLA